MLVKQMYGNTHAPFRYMRQQTEHHKLPFAHWWFTAPR